MYRRCSAGAGYPSPVPARATDTILARIPPWAATAALAALWLVIGPATPDLAAQVHRVDVFHVRGFAVWDGAWYAGHHLPGYSLSFPALGALVGARPAGALAAVASAALFGAVVGRRRPAAQWWFAVACIADLMVGRLTYALGVAVGLAAVLAIVRGRPVVACALAAACSATSPVAGLFLALAGVALAASGDDPWPLRRTPLAVAATALGTAAALAAAFPEGGDQPFPTLAFAVALAVTLAAAAVALGALRRAILLYAGAVVACEVVASPMGSNVMRLGAAFLAPGLLLAAGPTRGARRAALAATLVAVATWQWVDPLTQAARAWGDPSASPAYAAPLLARLRTDPPGGRVEIPLTRGHWETVSVAAAIPLARGWERQLDRRRDRLFYGPRLDPTAYRRWLAANAVSEVALPDAPMDPAGRAEAELVARRPAFLRPVWHDAHWRLFRVRGATPVASAGARARLAPDGVAVTTARPGRVLLRLRWTPYWRLAGGEGCVVPRRGWTVLDAPGPGRYVLTARFSLAGLVRRGPVCAG